MVSGVGSITHFTSEQTDLGRQNLATSGLLIYLEIYDALSGTKLQLVDQLLNMRLLKGGQSVPLRPCTEEDFDGIVSSVLSD